ncbi:hypothetical protein Tco_1259242, partial [Tanacetum coccineum]
LRAGDGGNGYYIDNMIVEGGRTYGDADFPCELGSGSGNASLGGATAGGGIIVMGSLDHSLSSLYIYGSLTADGESFWSKYKKTYEVNPISRMVLGGGIWWNARLELTRMSVGLKELFAMIARPPLFLSKTLSTRFTTEKDEKDEIKKRRKALALKDEAKRSALSALIPKEARLPALPPSIQASASGVNEPRHYTRRNASASTSRTLYNESDEDLVDEDGTVDLGNDREIRNENLDDYSE